MIIFRRLALLCLLTLGFMAFVPAGTSYAAWNPFDKACAGGGAGSAVCADKSATGDPITGSDGIIMNAVNIVSFIAGAAAVIFIVIAGIRFITSSGSADEVKGARRAIIYASIGLIVIALARTIVGFILGSI